MAHSVICQICKTRFDRDKNEYAVVGVRRYAHAECALRKAAKDGIAPPTIESPFDNVECIYCGKQMHRRKTKDCVMVSNGRYAHKECIELEKLRPKTDREILEEYIMKLFNVNYVSPRIKKQINQFMREYNFTESGILKSLKYAYEVKKLPLEKANGGIGIVPHVYTNAFNYYYAIWQATQKNTQTIKDLGSKELSVKSSEVKIKNPQRKTMIPSHFSFLDEGE